MKSKARIQLSRILYKKEKVITVRIYSLPHINIHMHDIHVFHLLTTKMKKGKQKRMNSTNQTVV